MRLGFIGTGAITSAIIHGLGTSFADQGVIHVSPRSAAISTALAQAFPHVRVAASNQAVLDESDVIILAVRPQISREVIPDLRFRADHHVISLIATLSLDALTGLVAPAPAVSKAVPLPSVALGRGPTAIFPPDPIAAALFDRIGTAIQVDRPEVFDALSAATGTMASYLAFAGAVSAWLVRNGVTETQARHYVASIFDGLSRTAIETPEQSFAALAADHATLGGLNEQLLKHVSDHGVFTALGEGLDAILSRITARPGA
ncbi:pyrroline-5-carboxylate reductase [Sphingomonas alpina]|uniref:NAD(P)-binding domain-containing protein n=1 Tax=Sphingomonas alpina TaxID=653931 RepID=A0A7H0LKL5_9SPHN|nr:pyrroline-5-carboxylate reductase [Sphingomonas alpina]QNQ10218.1 NAD(P)-binding domain-containing protein [Sphingomonas alpina]